MKAERNAWALPAGAAMAWLVLGGSVPLAAQQCRERDPAVLYGRVLDSRTGVPVQDASVTVWHGEAGSGRRHSVASDGSGRYRFCRLPPGRQLRVGATGAGPGPAVGVRLVARDSIAAVLEVEVTHSRLQGTLVTSAGDGLAEARISVAGTPLAVATGSDGRFAIEAIPAGRYRLRFEHPHHGTRTDSVHVEQGSTVDIVVQLAAAPIALPPLTVTVRSQRLENAGFYERRDHGPGVYLTRSDWQERSPLDASDLLRTVPGVTVASRPRDGTIVYDRSGCAFRYFIDGSKVGASFRLDDVPVAWLEALEVYRGPSEVPARFSLLSSNAGGHCGVIAIWTRR